MSLTSYGYAPSETARYGVSADPREHFASNMRSLQQTSSFRMRLRRNGGSVLAAEPRRWADSDRACS